MFNTDSWQEIFDSLTRHKLRTSLTAFGVFWGIFMLVNLMGVGVGLKNGAEANIGRLNNAVYVWASRPTSIPYRGLTKGRSIGLDDDDLQALLLRIPEIDLIAQKNSMGSQFATHKNNGESFEISGIVPIELPAKGFRLLAGRFFNDFDQNQSRKNVVIGQRVREVLFAEEDPIGQAISIWGVSFMVVGVVQPSALNGWAQRDMSTIFLPHNTLRKTFNQRDAIHVMMITPKPGVNSAQLENKIVPLLQERHWVHPNDKGVIRSYNVQKDYNEIQSLFGGITAFSWIVAIGTIIAGVVGVGNIMLITVKERTREIGIRKALGATPANIIGTILQESLAITLISGYAGLVCGVATIELIGRLASNNKGGIGTFVNPQVSFSTAATAILILVVAGAFAAYLPARKAASVDPVIALQDE